MRFLRHVADVDELKVIPFGDVHWGAKGCLKDKVVDELDYAKRVGAVLVGMGDWLEVATKESPGASPWEQVVPGGDQYDQVLDLLQPYKHLFIGWLTGNHEQRVFRHSGLDPSKILSRELGVPYLHYSAMIDFKVRGFHYIGYFRHGRSGARLPHTKIKNAMDMQNIANADLYVQGHVHELDGFPQPYTYVDIKDKMIRRRKKYFVLSGHFLDYDDSYAEEAGMALGKTGVAKIKLFGDRWDIHVST